jgi:hypothetical protein
VFLTDELLSLDLAAFRVRLVQAGTAPPGIIACEKERLKRRNRGHAQLSDARKRQRAKEHAQQMVSQTSERQATLALARRQDLLIRSVGAKLLACVTRPTA